MLILILLLSSTDAHAVLAKDTPEWKQQHGQQEQAPQPQYYAPYNPHAFDVYAPREPGSVLCPDGNYVSPGPCKLCPDGTYVSRKCKRTPNGKYIGG